MNLFYKYDVYQNNLDKSVPAGFAMEANSKDLSWLTNHHDEDATIYAVWLRTGERWLYSVHQGQMRDIRLPDSARNSSMITASERSHSVYTRLFTGYDLRTRGIYAKTNLSYLSEAASFNEFTPLRLIAGQVSNNGAFVSGKFTTRAVELIIPPNYAFDWRRVYNAVNDLGELEELTLEYSGHRIKAPEVQSLLIPELQGLDIFDGQTTLLRVRDGHRTIYVPSGL